MLLSAVRSLGSKLPSTGVSIFAEMTRLANEHGAINLSQGFPNFECAPTLVEAVAQRMREGHNQYVSMLGVPELRQALATKIERLYGHRYDPATEITITAGATEGLFSTLMALVHPGDEVVMFEPAYDAYAPAVQLAGGTPVFATLRFPDYRINWDEVRALVTPRTRLLLVNSPHNPTGTLLTGDDLRALARLLEGTDALVVADEVYEHIVFDGKRHLSICGHPDIAARAVVVSSFGKTHHTTGWKVGYCSAPAPISAEIQRVHQFVTFSVNGAVQLAYADVVAADPESREVGRFYQQKRDRFLALLAGSAFRPLACQGTFFQLVDYSALTREGDAEFALRLVRTQGVAAIPLSPFLYATAPDPVLRFCFGKRDQTLAEAAERLCALTPID
jgi:methionine aminotransferase